MISSRDEECRGVDRAELPLSKYLQELEGSALDGRGWRAWLKSWLTTAILPVERRRARRWSASPTAIRLHLGCADNYLPGWLNVDLFRPGRRLDLFWDLRRPLPVPADSVQVVFTEHLLEHLSGSQALQVVRDCARVLSSEGVLRVGVPDLGRYIRSYAGEDPLIDEVRPGRPTKALAFCEVFYRFGHRSMYDFDTLRALCLEAGFADVEPSRFGEGRIQPSPDSAARRAETLYVDAIK